MKFSLRNWGAKQLLLSWGVYWLALVATTLTPALLLLARVSRTDAHGNASASFNDGTLSATISAADGAAWTGAIHFSALIFVVFGPPLLLWVLWAVSRPRRDTGSAPPALLGEAPYDGNISARDRAPERDRLT